MVWYGIDLYGWVCMPLSDFYLNGFVNEIREAKTTKKLGTAA